jgi:hypothetical protein
MVAAGLIGAMAAPATAGKTRHLVGAFEDEPGSSVSMTVKLNNKNRPKFVKNIVFSGLSMLCDDDESSIPTPRTLGPLEVPGRLRVDLADGFGKRFKDVDEDLSHFSFGGTLLNKGKQAVGRVGTYSGTRCSVLAYYLAKKE